MEFWDEKTVAAVERRRRMEEERKQRIFNEKTRTKGVDTTGIEEQIRMKKEIKEQEEARERAIAEELLNIERQLELLVQRHEEAKKQVTMETMKENQALIGMRSSPLTYQGPDMDTTLPGASNMLRFNGEDAEKKDRTKVQQQQIVQWNEEQSRLKNQRIKAEKEADMLYDQQTRAMHMKLAELEREHQKAKAAVRMADKEYNRFLGDTKKDVEILAKREDSVAAVNHVLTSANSPLLTEKGQTTSALSSTRVIPYAFKGMTPEQRRAITEEQERQRREKEEARRAQEEEERLWAAQQAAVQRAALLKEREVQRSREDIHRKLLVEQRSLAKEKAERYEHLYKNVYSNQATDEYFGQFNTSSR